MPLYIMILWQLFKSVRFIVFRKIHYVPEYLQNSKDRGIIYQPEVHLLVYSVTKQITAPGSAIIASHVSTVDETITQVVCVVLCRTISNSRLLIEFRISVSTAYPLKLLDR